MKLRTITGLTFAAISIFLICYSNLTQSIFLYTVAGFCLYEYLRITNANNKAVSIVGIILGVGILAGLDFLEPPCAYHISIVCSVIFFLYLFMLKKTSVKDIHQRWGVFISIFYLVLPLGIFLLFVGKYNANFLLYLTLLIWVADTGAYLVGRSIGKRKFSPRISPKKTWEGFLGGGMLTMIMAYILYSIENYGFSMQFWLLFALVIWIFGAMGDLVESQIKRGFDIKDSSNILPGHGGFLDRFDGFIYCLPFIGLLVSLYGN